MNRKTGGSVEPPPVAGDKLYGVNPDLSIKMHGLYFHNMRQRVLPRGYCASGRTFSLVFPEKIAYNGY
jgi:hypothetical protein